MAIDKQLFQDFFAYCTLEGLQGITDISLLRRIEKHIHEIKDVIESAEFKEIPDEVIKKTYKRIQEIEDYMNETIPLLMAKERNLIN